MQPAASMLPAASHLHLQLLGPADGPRLLITLPRLRLHWIASIVYAVFVVVAWCALVISLLVGEWKSLLQLVGTIALCCLGAHVARGVPGRRALQLEVSPKLWRMTQRRGGLHMLPGCAIVAVGRTGDIAAVEVRICDVRGHCQWRSSQRYLLALACACEPLQQYPASFTARGCPAQCRERMARC